jgi:hypothetical protein
MDHIVPYTSRLITASLFAVTTCYSMCMSVATLQHGKEDAKKQLHLLSIIN